MKKYYYNATIFVTRAEDAMIYPVGRWNKSPSTSLQDIIDICKRSLANQEIAFDQNARVELWEFCDDGGGKLIFEKNKRD